MPFPKTSESKYDVYDVGHSSTSISIATGIALANKYKNKKTSKQVVAIIGDGVLGGGMAMEALNHAGDSQVDILVILNDNQMSISPNVGAMHKYLTRLSHSTTYNKLKKRSKNYLNSAPRMKEAIKKVKSRAKKVILPKTIFEELGFRYYGPIDGHDVGLLVKTLKK